jgi:SAM-dependent methyltransferase
MALALAPDLSPRARYVGIDVHAASIAWCRRRFAADARFRFEHAPVVSAYGRGGVAIADYRLPVGEGAAHLVLAKSLFTHLSESEAGRYLAEIARILSPDGRALVTAFLFGANSVPAFPHGGDRFRWRVKSRPAAATAFARRAWGKCSAASGIADRARAPGFSAGECGGSWTGRSPRFAERRRDRSVEPHGQREARRFRNETEGQACAGPNECFIESGQWFPSARSSGRHRRTLPPSFSLYRYLIDCFGMRRFGPSRDSLSGTTCQYHSIQPWISSPSFSMTTMGSWLPFVR